MKVVPGDKSVALSTD